jgi:hypothetical protein
VLHSVLHDKNGGAVEIVDFAPRYDLHNRTHRPPMLVRRITPIAGRPMIRVVARPMSDYGGSALKSVRGSHHIAYFSDRQRQRPDDDDPSQLCDGGASLPARRVPLDSLGPR